MKKILTVPRGTSDILPENIQPWLEIESKSRRLLKIHGYQEIRTPYFEETELFARSMGQASDVVQKQMLTLQSQKKSDANDVSSAGLALRPEGTASVVRSYIQNNLDKKENLSKLFYFGAMFRGERPQKGRLRQFHQVGVEAIGPESASPYLDAEVICLCTSILSCLGIKDFQLKLNTLGTREDKSNFADFLRNQLKAYLAQLCEDCQSRFERNVFRVLDCKNKKCRELVSKLNFSRQWLSPDSQKYFSQLKEILNDLRIEFQESPYLVRGLDYYTHTVFEVSSASLGSQDALGAGGRYNHLVEELGGPKADAVGFALGVERILLALSANTVAASNPLDVYLIVLDEASTRTAFLLMEKIREIVHGLGEDIAIDMGYRSASMKNQMRFANKVGARYAVILGENELKNGTVSIKDMKTGQQCEEKINEVDKIVNLLIS